MYQNREPRFYVTVYYPGSGWKHGTTVGIATFAAGGPGNTTHDYPQTGYMVNKWYDHNQDSYQGQWGDMTFPTFRYGEIILNYIEAVLECEANGVSGPDVSHDLAMTLWTDLRGRSGMEPIEEVYPGASIEELIDLCHRERQVELAQEGLRVKDTNVPAAMWTRAVTETRVFRNNHYLYPFLQRELDRNKVLVQNYGW